MAFIQWIAEDHLLITCFDKRPPQEGKIAWNPGWMWKNTFMVVRALHCVDISPFSLHSVQNNPVSHPRCLCAGGRCSPPLWPWTPSLLLCVPHSRRPPAERPGSCCPGSRSPATCSGRSTWQESCPAGRRRVSSTKGQYLQCTGGVRLVDPEILLVCFIRTKIIQITITAELDP